MQKGFSLLEIMIAVAIIGILVAIAVPSYQNHKVRVNRSDMRTELLRIAQNLQRYQVSNKTFKDAATTLGLTNKKYPDTGTALYTVVLDITDNDKAWTLTATPIASTPQKADGSLVLNSKGQKCWTERESCSNLTDSSSWDDK